MKVEESDDKRTMQKVIKIDYRSIMEPNFAEIIYQSVIKKVANQIAEEYLNKNSAKILSNLDIDVITNLVNITIAKKVQEDHDILMNRIDPMARSIPSLIEDHDNKMKSILKKHE